MECINDSLLAFISNIQHFHIYNYSTGDWIDSLDVDQIQPNDLINNILQPRYLTRNYLSLEEAKGPLGRRWYRLDNFLKTENGFIIAFGLSTPQYDNYELEGESLRAKIWDYSYFMITTTNDLKVNRITPIYTQDMPKGLYTSFTNGFFANDSVVYVSTRTFSSMLEKPLEDNVPVISKYVAKKDGYQYTEQAFHLSQKEITAPFKDGFSVQLHFQHFEDSTQPFSVWTFRLWVMLCSSKTRSKIRQFRLKK